jgi:hypothetical protein
VARAVLTAVKMMPLLLLLGASCVERDGYHCDRSVEMEIVADQPNRLKLNVALGDVVSIDLPPNIEIRGSRSIE